MECGKAAAAAEEDGGGRMVVCELEAAEALAGMARCSAAHVMEALVITQDQPVAAERGCDYAPLTFTSPQKIVEHIPTQLCSTSHQSKPLMKFRRKLTEAEKEERKLRHVMANRESARQTIRRRQEMHLELTRKAAYVLEENENLKKQKKLMLEDFNIFKGRNEFLKAQLAELQKVAAGETEEEPNSSEAQKPCSAATSTPIFLQNQPPSLVPCFWPSIVPSSDVFPFQCTSHPHNMSSLQFPMPPGDTPWLHQGQEHSMATPVMIVPVPWLLPLLTHSSSTSGANTHYCGKCLCSDTRLIEDTDHLLSNQNMRAEAYYPMKSTCTGSDRRVGMTSPQDNGVQSSVRQPPSAIVVPGLFSPVRRLENLEPPSSCQVHDITADLRLVSAHGSVRNCLSQTNREKPEDMTVATEARRRRKELMRLKNANSS